MLDNTTEMWYYYIEEVKMIIVHTQKGIINLVHEKDDEEKVYQGEVLLAEGDAIHIHKGEIVCTVDGKPSWQATLS